MHIKNTVSIYVNKVWRSQMLRRVAKLGSITMLANILGFLVPVYIANTYGVSQDTDDFLFSYSIITFVGNIFSSSVSAACVPFLKEKQLAGHQEFEEFISTIFYYILKYVGTLTMVSFCILLLISHWQDSNFIFYLSISTPIFFFIVLNAFYYGILNSLNQFNLAATSPFSRAIIIFATIYFLHERFGIASAILGYNLGEFAKMFHLTYVIRKKNKIHFSIYKKSTKVVKGFLKAGSFQALSSTIAASSPMFDKIVASFLALGTISLLDYGDKMFTVFNVLLNSFLTIILSKWAGDVAENKFKKSEFDRTLIVVMIGSIAMCFIIYFMRFPIVNFLYPNLKFDEREKIGMLLVISMLGFVFNSATQITNRAVVAFKATQILVKLAIIRLVLNISLDLILVYFLGIYGIVLATVVANMICLGTVYTLFNNFRKRKYYTADVPLSK